MRKPLSRKSPRVRSGVRDRHARGHGYKVRVGQQERSGEIPRTRFGSFRVGHSLEGRERYFSRYTTVVLGVGRIQVRKAGEPLRFERISGAKRDFASVIDAEHRGPSL